MFQAARRRSAASSAFATFELIFHSTVRQVRNAHRNALVGLLLAILQTGLGILIFWFMFTYLPLSKVPRIRGDMVLYLMSGVFLYMVHIRATKAVFSAEGPLSAMMLHEPMNTMISISASALAALYTQLLSIGVILFLYNAFAGPIEIENPVGFVAMIILAWLFGVAVGLILASLRPWWPEACGIVQTVWTRANIFASGKLFTANTLSASMLALFSWNPLFHIIDQSRGYMFINYQPRFTSIAYPLAVTLALLAIGMLIEFYTRRHISISWSAGR